MPQRLAQAIQIRVLKRKRLAVSAASKLVGGIATSKITTFWWKREKAEVVAMDVALKSTASKH